MTAIPLSQVGDRPLCSRCSKREENRNDSELIADSSVSHLRSVRYKTPAAAAYGTFSRSADRGRGHDCADRSAACAFGQTVSRGFAGRSAAVCLSRHRRGSRTGRRGIVYGERRISGFLENLFLLLMSLAACRTVGETGMLVTKMGGRRDNAAAGSIRAGSLFAALEVLKVVCR